MVAVAIGGAALVGGAATVIAGNKAAKAAQNAANTSADVQRYQYDTTRADYAPYRQVGQDALYKLADMYGVSRPTGAPSTTPAGGVGSASGAMYGFNPQTGTFGASGEGATGSDAMTPGFDGFQASPGYAFRKSQAIDASKASFASRGLLGSTAAEKNVAERVDGLASSEYDSFANRLAALAGVGQSATGSTAAAGTSAANGISSAVTAAGNARASAYSNTGSAISNGAQNLASLYLYQQNGGFGGGGVTPGIY